MPKAVRKGQSYGYGGFAALAGVWGVPSQRFQNIRKGYSETLLAAELVLEWGFLPLFKNAVEGFSVEEHTPPELWFADGVDGPWEWKGPVIRQTDCAYGKLFRGRAGFVSAEWYPDFANYRRDGYDFDARYEDGLAPYQDKTVYEIIEKQDSLLSKEVTRWGILEKRTQRI